MDTKKLIANGFIVDINRLPSSVTLSNEHEINRIRIQYDRLDSTTKSLVTNYPTLQKAEEQIIGIHKQKASEMIRCIDLLPESITLSDAENIKHIREQFMSMGDVAKSFVTNYAKLQEAEETIIKLQDEINSMKVASLDEIKKKIVEDVSNSLVTSSITMQNAIKPIDITELIKSRKLVMKLLENGNGYEIRRGKKTFYLHTIFMSSYSLSIPPLYKGKPITSIHKEAFCCCSIASIYIPESVTSIHEEAFCDCSHLSTVQVDPKNTSYHSDNNCIIETNSKTLIYGRENSIIPTDGSVTSIGANAFCDCKALTKIVIPNGVTSIGNSAFSNCSELVAIFIPDSVISVGVDAFHGCSLLASLQVDTNNSTYHSASNCIIETKSKCLTHGCRNSIIPTDGSVTCIGDFAFCNCDTLTQIEIPYSVTSIGKEAFFCCNSLTQIKIPYSVTSIGKKAFGCCESLNSLQVDSNNTTYHSVNNCIIETKSKTLVQGSNSSIIPADGSVTIIGCGAFWGCSFLSNVTIPDCVTGIGEYAFVWCSSPKKIKIPNSVTSIGKLAFGCCTSLTEITIPQSVTSIGEGAFFYCQNLTKMKVDAKNRVYHSAGNCIIKTDSKCLTHGCEKSIIPSDGSVTVIDKEAFKHCSSLTKINIPKKITEIGQEAFCECTSLKTIIYDGTPKEWEAIKKGEYWDDSTDSYTIQYGKSRWKKWRKK